MQSPAEQYSAALGQQARRLPTREQLGSQQFLLSGPQQLWRHAESNAPPSRWGCVARGTASDQLCTWVHWLYMAMPHNIAQIRSKITAIVLPAVFMSGCGERPLQQQCDTSSNAIAMGVRVEVEVEVGTSGKR